jgi:uncharacterized protein
VKSQTASLDRKGAGGERRCIVTGEVGDTVGLIRFVVGPDGEIVPDIEGHLPGRGLWVAAEGAILRQAVARNAFAKAAKAAVKVSADLPERVDARLRARMCSDLGLARRAGLAVFGFEKVLKSLDGSVPIRVMVEAGDGAADGRRKLRQAAAARNLEIETVDCLLSAELSLALGCENVIHAAVKPGVLADRLVADAAKLAGLRALSLDGTAGPTPARNERNA